MSQAVRDSGVYAVHEGESFLVAYIDRSRVAAPTFSGGLISASTFPIPDLERLERVETIGEWRGTTVQVGRIQPSLLAWVKVTDAEVAEQRGLYGDPDQGWGAAVPLHELDNLREEVTDLLAQPD